MGDSDKNNTISEEDILSTGNFLVFLPFYMCLLSHKSISGHARYVVADKMKVAYLNWISRQNESTWKELKDAWGGEIIFDETVKAIACAAGNHLRSFSPTRVG